MKYKIVACIPSKNEEFIIDKVLKVLSKFCYKIIVNDDNSTDRTQEICKSYEKVDLLIRLTREMQYAIQRNYLHKNVNEEFSCYYDSEFEVVNMYSMIFNKTFEKSLEEMINKKLIIEEDVHVIKQIKNLVS